jgi:hypothetical protein
MEGDSGSLVGALTARYTKARGILAGLSSFVVKATFRIKRGSSEETVAEVARRWRLDDRQRNALLALGASRAGAAFIDERVRAINRAAFHRSAFVLNGLTQFGFVDLAAQLSLHLPQLKLGLLGANLLLAIVAHVEMRQGFRSLLAGPSALPPKRRLWGLLRNPAYNKAVKRSSRPHARSAWREKSLYRLAYFVNALTMFLGAQFILPPDRLVFPFGLIVDKLTGLFSTLVMVLDVWRGIRAGDDARLAREREVAAYRDLDI